MALKLSKFDKLTKLLELANDQHSIYLLFKLNFKLRPYFCVSNR